MGALVYPVIDVHSEAQRWGLGADGNYSQVGGSVQCLGKKEYVSLTITAAGEYGNPAGVWRPVHILCQGRFYLEPGTRIYSRWNAGGIGGAAIAAVGVGNNGANGKPYVYAFSSADYQRVAAGAGCGSGGGGGGVANKGGSSGYALTNYPDQDGGQYLSNQIRYGQIINGDNGRWSTTFDDVLDYDYHSCPRRPGCAGSGAGSGGIDSIGTGVTTGTSGKGGDGGDSGGIIDIRAKNMVITGALIDAGGDDGEDGGDAVDSANLDADCGGGGSGAPGSGGTVCVLCETIDDDTGVISTAGVQGASGAGVGTGGQGGIGGASGDGYRVVDRLAA